MDEKEYLRHDGLGLARLVADGEATAAELLEIARARADRFNPRLNAICMRLDEMAVERAKQPLSGLFAGVPFLLKDLYQDIAGVRTYAGTGALRRREYRAPATSTIVERWLDAGLVIFGKTATPEFGAKGVTEPEAFGPTRNPWNVNRTPGGSSGGAAAAVAAGIIPVAAASDGGGSIRIPAACCGLVGLKPGRGLVPAGPDLSEPLNGLATAGVVSRTVRDTAAMLDVLAGPDAMAAYAPDLPETPYRDEVGQDPGRLRIGFTTASATRERPHPEAVRAAEAAAALLEQLGHEVEEVAPPHDDRRLARHFLTIWFAHQAVIIDELKELVGARETDFEVDTRAMAALGRLTSAVELEAAYEGRHRHIADLAAFHERYDLLMTPTLGEPPVEVGSLDLPRGLRIVTDVLLRLRLGRLLKVGNALDQAIDRNLGWVPYTQLANMTGRPAITLPLHWTPDGLPLGVQFVAPLRGEALLLRLAGQLEQAAPWFDRRPPGFD